MTDEIRAIDSAAFSEGYGHGQSAGYLNGLMVGTNRGFDKGWDRGWIDAIDTILEYLDEGEPETFTVASWVTRSRGVDRHPDEARLRSVRAVRVDELRALLETER